MWPIVSAATIHLLPLSFSVSCSSKAPSLKAELPSSACCSSTGTFLWLSETINGLLTGYDMAYICGRSETAGVQIEDEKEREKRGNGTMVRPRLDWGCRWKSRLLSSLSAITCISGWVRAIILHGEFQEQKWEKRRLCSELNVESDPFTVRTDLSPT